MRYAFIAFILIGFLSLVACVEQRSQTFTLAEQDSILQERVQSFRQEQEAVFTKTIQKVNQTLALLEQEPRFELTLDEKIPIALPVCNSRGCRFQSENLALMVMKQRLTQEKNPWALLPPEAGKAFKNLLAIENQKFQATRYKNDHFKIVQARLEEDLEEMDMLWQARWLLVLEIENYQKPSQAGGGGMQGYWHIFDFQEVKYLGAILLESGNTQGFVASHSQQRTVEKDQYTRKYLPNGQVISETQKTTETQTEYTDPVLGYERDLKDNFKEQLRNSLKEYFMTEKGQSLYF